MPGSASILHTLFPYIRLRSLDFPGSGDSPKRKKAMRPEGLFPDHSIAFEVDTAELDGPGCACILCRPRGSFLSFMSRDDLHANDGPPAHRFDRQRLNHQFTAVIEVPAPWVPAPCFEQLTLTRRA